MAEARDKMAGFVANMLWTLLIGSGILLILSPFLLGFRKLFYKIEAEICVKTQDGDIIPKYETLLKPVKLQGFQRWEFFSKLFRKPPEPIEPLPTELIYTPIRNRNNIGRVYLLKHSNEVYTPLRRTVNRLGEFQLEPISASHKNFLFQSMKQDANNYLLKDWYERWGKIVVPFMLVGMILIFGFLQFKETKELGQITANSIDRLASAEENFTRYVINNELGGGTPPIIQSGLIAK